MKMFAKNSFQSNTLYGLHLKDVEPHPSGKWAVSLEDYPNETYPEFITGASTLYPSMIISSMVGQLFRMVHQNKPILFLDDVLISGIVAEQLGILRAPLSGIEDCSCTDLLSRTIISECTSIRRTYVWSKFALARIEQNTFEIDRLIQTTTYIKWNGNFTHTRNGTAILSTTERNISDGSFRILIINTHPISLLIILCILMCILNCFYIRRKLLSLRQASMCSSTTIKSNSALLSTFPK